MERALDVSEAEAVRGLKANVVAAAFGIISPAVVGGLPLIMLLEALGATGVLIGMIAMLNQAAMLVQIPAAMLAGRLGKRKPFWFVTVLIARAIWVVPACLAWMAPSEWFPLMIRMTLLVTGISAVLIQSSSASWWSWMADLIPSRLNSRFWSIRQGVCTCVMLAIFILAGWVLDFFPQGDLSGFALVLIVATVAGSLEPLIHLRVPEPVHEVGGAGGLSVVERLLRPLRDTNYRTFTLILCVWFFGLGLIGPFTMVYLKQEFDALYTHLAVLQAAGLAGSIIASFYATRLIQRIGLKPFGICMLLLSPLFHAVWFVLGHGEVAWTLPLAGEMVFPRYVVLIFFNSLLAGGVYASFGIYQLNMLTSMIPREGRTVAMAMHWFLIGCVSAVAPLLGGVIKDAMEKMAPPGMIYGELPFAWMHLLLLIHAVLIWGVAFPMTRKLRGVETDWPVPQALGWICITNPMRMARDMYGFNGAVLAAARRVVARVRDK